MTERNFAGLLRALHDGRVDFILVGGLAAVLQGAPVSTFDPARLSTPGGRIASYY